MNRQGSDKQFLLILMLSFILITGIGFYTYKNGQIKTTNLPQNTSADEIANWETYTNEGFGVSFKYPADYTHTLKYSSQRKDVWQFLNLELRKGSALITFQIYPLDAPDLESWIEKHSDYNEAGPHIGKATNIKPHIHSTGVPALEYLTTVSPSNNEYLTRSVAFMYNDMVYDFSLVYPFRNDLSNNTFDQILSTFEFIPDTSDWRTLSNTELGFELKYPENFFVNTNQINGKARVKIADDNKFEDSETSLVITIQQTNSDNFMKSNDLQLEEVLNKVGYNTLQQKYSNNIEYNFLGNPPWGYYQMSIPKTDDKNDSILLTVRLHRADDLTESVGGSNGKQAQIAKQILSTFEFTD